MRRAQVEPAVGQRSIASFFTPSTKSRPVAAAARDAPGSARAPESTARSAPAACPTPSGEASGQALVGSAIKVYWKAERKWFSGRVAKYASSKDRHQILYDDGDEEWTCLSRRKWRLEGQDEEKKGPKKPDRKTTPTVRKAIVGSEDEEAASCASVEASGSEYEASEESESGTSSLDPASDSDAAAGVAGSDGLAASPSVAGKRPRPAAAPAARPKKARLGGEAGSQVDSVALESSSVNLTPGAATPASRTLPPLTPASRSKPACFAGLGSQPSQGSLARAGAGEGGTQGGGLGGSQPPPTPATPGALSEALGAAAEERFADRLESLAFLKPEAVRDAKQRRPDHPLFDASTVHVPPRWLDANKVSEGQRQWWAFKAQHMDSLVLFKVGKFYEVFEMDAFPAAEALGLAFMRGDQPHVGFPEAVLASQAAQLARAGHRVVVVEQTETPELLARRNEQRRAKGLKKANVVAREVVAVLSPGTMVEPEMLGDASGPLHLLCLAERPRVDGIPGVCFGAVAVDAAGGRLLLGQWSDDELRSGLLAVLVALRPAEVLWSGLREGREGAGSDAPLPQVSLTTRRLVRATLQGPALSALPPEEGIEAWTARSGRRRLLEAFAPDGERPPLGPMPEVAGELCRNETAQALALAALGGALRYLERALLDRRVLSSGQLGWLRDEVGVGEATGGGVVDAAVEKTRGDGPRSSPLPPPPAFLSDASPTALTMALDGTALDNLDVLGSASGPGAAGSLLAAVDRCATAMGRQRLRSWLCRPLCRAADIVRRQDAVAALMGDDAAERAGAARLALKKGGPLQERALAKLCAWGRGAGDARDAPHVVLYEDVARRRVRLVSGALRSLRAAEEALAALAGCEALGGTLAGEWARQGLGLGLGGASDGAGVAAQPRCASTTPLSAGLEHMEGAADWAAAEASGAVVPAPGVDVAYDAARALAARCSGEVEAYVARVRSLIRAPASLARLKDSCVLEVGERVAVPDDWEPAPGKKGVRRYATPELRALAAAREAAEAEVERAAAGILARLVADFAARTELWTAALEAAARLDALLSLAMAAQEPGMCRPRILRVGALHGEAAEEEWAAADEGDRKGWALEPTFLAEGLGHPARVPGAGGGPIVPGDVVLGGAGVRGARAAPFLALTGPNMGGKSTLMRKVCLAQVLAQAGAWVPAAALSLTPADALFVRTGARDRLVAGHSTFFVECAETAAALARASRHSLVALDELGRGTSTADGAALAAATLKFLAREVGCRGVFATHYHALARDCEGDPAVQLAHMACRVESGGGGRGTPGVPRVTFLYTLAPGDCPKSYATNVARLAGLPEEVVTRAAAVAEAAELRGGGLEGGKVGLEGTFARAFAAVRSLLGAE